jgi:cytochrome d ubiquinol oxidase subunit I
MLALTLAGLVLWRRGRLASALSFQRTCMLAAPLGFVAVLAGWVTTEVGRQPWVVYDVLRTRDAVTDAGGLPVAFFAMLAVYLGLAGLVAWLLRRLAREREAAA